MFFVNVRELKNKTSELLRAVRQEDVIITNRGKPVAFLRALREGRLEEIPGRSGAGRVGEEPDFYRAGDSEKRPGQAGRTREISPESALAAFPAQAGNALKAVFWDLPELTDMKILRNRIAEAKAAVEPDTLRWYLVRFLERGRVLDTIALFGLDAIRLHLPDLRISARARAKWDRILDVYGRA